MKDNVLCEIDLINTDNYEKSEKNFKDTKEERYEKIKENYISILKNMYENLKNLGETEDLNDDDFNNNKDYLSSVNEKIEDYFENDTENIILMEKENERLKKDNIKTLEDTNNLMKELKNEKKQTKTYEDEYNNNSSITKNNEKLNKSMIYINFVIFILIIFGIIYIFVV